MVATVATAGGTSDWVDLGAGPMVIQAMGPQTLLFAIADSKPASTTIGFHLPVTGPPMQLTTTSHVWVYSGPTGANGATGGGYAITAK